MDRFAQHDTNILGCVSNLYEFAVMFRGLDCADALFLDGDPKQMKTGAAMLQPSNQFGSIIAITKQASVEIK